MNDVEDHDMIRRNSSQSKSNHSEDGSKYLLLRDSDEKIHSDSDLSNIKFASLDNEPLGDN